MAAESIIIRELSNGLKCYCILKPGYVGKQAVLAVDYGAADLVFTPEGQAQTQTTAGVAHFLEHKLFEEPQLNLYEAFCKQGADVNAFTNFTNTAYYFTAIDQFEENLRLLFSFVQNPYFTDENVEKEKGIIAQEIAMYDDDPVARVYMNLMKALFHQSPVRNDIAGTAESISGITKDLLYHCYQNFYTLANMAFICVGDFEPEAVLELAEQQIKSTQAIKAPIRFYGEEPSHREKDWIEEAMPVSQPIFQLGYKSIDVGGKGSDLGTKAAASMVLTDIIAGESSDLYAALYQEGLIDNHFGVAYIGGTFYGTSLFAGQGPNPSRTAEMIFNEIQRLKGEGISPERFELIKQKHLGQYRRNMNSLDHLATTQVDLHNKGLDVFTFLNCLERLTINDAEERLHNHLQEENRALSVITPAAP